MITFSNPFHRHLSLKHSIFELIISPKVVYSWADLCGDNIRLANNRGGYTSQ